MLEYTVAVAGFLGWISLSHLMSPYLLCWLFSVLLFSLISIKTLRNSKFTDLAIDRINSQEKPWFLWLAYTAPHTPFHAPPSNMHTQGNLPDYSSGMDAMPYYMAAIEAMDFQIGRLLDNIPANERNNTIIILKLQLFSLILSNNFSLVD